MGCSASTAMQGSGDTVHERYLFCEKLGQGSFGQVRSCTQRETGRGFAVKILDAPDLRKRGPCPGYDDSACRRRKEAEQEGKLWQRIGWHRNVVRLTEAFVDERFTYFVMERCHRSLLDGLLKKRQLPATELLGNFCEMLMGIQHVHKVGVIHRDIKPANYLIGFDGAVKLCDFGLSTVEPKGGAFGVVGTAPFMSPEMLRKAGRYTRSTDIWSFAATAYILLYGRYVYDPVKTSTTEMYNAVGRMKRAIIWNDPKPAHKPKSGLPMPPQELQLLVVKLLERDCSKRMSATEALTQCQATLSEMEAAEEAWLAKSASAAVAAATRVCISSLPTGKSEFQPRPDPTVEKGMDELLDELQTRCKGIPTRAFSSTIGDKSEVASRACRSTVSKKSLRRVTTHCGEMSLKMSTLESEDLCPMDDDSTTASSGDSGDKELFEEKMEHLEAVAKVVRPPPGYGRRLAI